MERKLFTNHTFDIFNFYEKKISNWKNFYVIPAYKHIDCTD